MRALNSASNPTSPTLIARLKERDAQGWERLATLYAPAVYEWARNAGLQACDAADLTQEVFQAVLMRIARFEYGAETPRFRAWLWGITRNKIRDHYRRNVKHPIAFGGDEAASRFAELPQRRSSQTDEYSPEKLTGGLARRALGLIQSDFSESTWQAFWLIAIEGLAGAEVAERLGMSVGAVYTAKSRVLSLLRRELGGLC